jgi:glycosyltransferase involved in cell wall biosynthesis
MHPADSPVPEFLASLDIFGISSISEALPISVLEAMAAGLPIVSTRVGGIPDVAPEKEVAWFCEPSDPDALFEILSTAAVSSDLATRGLRAQEIVMSRYSSSVMAQRYLDLIAEIAEAKGYSKELTYCGLH